MHTEPNETLPATRSALPDAWIGRIFDHMSALYGSRFADLWRGSDLATIRRMWAEKLAGFRTIPGAIKEALDSLDSKPYPPTLPEFLAMCRESAPRHQVKPALIDYKPTPEEQAAAAEVIRKASESINRAPSHNFRTWAKKLKVRHETGESLILLQVQDYQEALADVDKPETGEIEKAA